MASHMRFLALSLILVAGSFASAHADGPYPYVIVTDTTLVAAFLPLAAAHAGTGLPSTVRSVQGIQAQYPAGRDQAESIRMFIQAAHGAWGTRFVLLGGDEPLVPWRRAYARLSQGSGLSDVMLPTDQYYASLSGSWDSDGDSLWGEVPYPTINEPGDDMSYTPDLSVGRAPVASESDAALFVQKTLAALAGRSGSPSSVSVMLTAPADQFGNQLLDWASYTEQLIPNLAGLPSPGFDRYYQNSSAWPGSVPESRAAVLAALDANHDIAVLTGHGGTGVFVAGAYPQDNITAADIQALTNAQPMLAYLQSAYTHQPGAGSIAAALSLAPNGGAVAALGATDIQFLGTGSSFMQAFFDQLVDQHAATIGEALENAIATQTNGQPVNDFARLTYQGTALFGDPALPAPWTIPGPVAVALAFIDSDVRPDGVRLTWFSSGGTGLVADVERRTETTDWTTIGRVTPDGTGHLDYLDASIAAGTRYGYRLALVTAAGREYFGEAWVSVPAPVFALLGPRTNPVSRDLSVRFTLADARPARLELFDVGGRLVRGLAVGNLGGGLHAVDLAGGRMPAPGIYMLRLSGSGRSFTMRTCVVR